MPQASITHRQKRIIADHLVGAIDQLDLSEDEGKRLSGRMSELCRGFKITALKLSLHRRKPDEDRLQQLRASGVF